MLGVFEGLDLNRKQGLVSLNDTYISVLASDSLISFVVYTCVQGYRVTLHGAVKVLTELLPLVQVVHHPQQLLVLTTRHIPGYLQHFTAMLLLQV